MALDQQNALVHGSAVANCHTEASHPILIVDIQIIEQNSSVVWKKPRIHGFRQVFDWES